MRLPDPRKVAFNHEAIFKQQQVESTHDIGLQMVLHILHMAVSKAFPEVAHMHLLRYEFTINVGGPSGVTVLSSPKWFSVNLLYPKEAKLRIAYAINTETLQYDWTVICNGHPFMTAEVHREYVERWKNETRGYVPPAFAHGKHNRAIDIKEVVE